MSALAGLLLAASAALAPLPLPLPGAGPGRIGFDDLVFSRGLGRVLVPAGRTGRLYLVAPGTHAVEAIEGFSGGGKARLGHGDGTTSADAGRGLLFAADRTARSLAVVDPAARRVIARVRLSGGPDYVRWVEPTGEVWVTEPDVEAIETFRLEPDAPQRLVPAGVVHVPGGPESLVVDPARRRAYTNTWHDETLAIDLEARTIAARWRNGCRGARGIALDADRGLVFVGCDEGKAVALDAARGGAVAGTAKVGAGVDVIAYAPERSHLYVSAAEAGTLAILSVGPRGELRPVRTVATAAGAHCVAADDRGGVYVCDPEGGRLLVLRDPDGAAR